MNSRALVINTLNFESPPRVPRQCWILPWALKKFPEETAKLGIQFPDDIIPVPGMYSLPQNFKGNRYEEGLYIDEWGCIFNNIHAGLIGVPVKPILTDWNDLDSFHGPDEMLAVDTEMVNAFCRTTDKFKYSNSWIRPFERYQFIRTTELAMMDIALDSPEMKLLIGKIHDHYLKETEAWARTDIDAIGIMDDWGMQKGMMVSPDHFREYYKPLYKEYVSIARKYGKYVFMHSDGNIEEIIPDLIEIGIDALNSQLFCMNIEDLGRKYKGKITFWGEIDRQYVLSSGDRRDVENAVKVVFENLYTGGGVIAQCEFGPAARPENIFHVFDCWNKLTNK